MIKFYQMKKRDVLIISAILCIALAALAARALFKEPAVPEVVVYLNGKEQATLPLRPGTYAVDQGDRVNVIEVFEDGVRMQSSTCPNQNCVQQGKLTLETAKTSDLGALIVCLPNGVTVELRGAG